MASPRQLEANRRNAQLSTGPRTDEGKTRSRGNALTHGLTAAVAAPPDEAAEADRRAGEWSSSLRPSDAFEVYLVHRMATAAVRVERCEAEEQAHRDRAAARAAASWEDDRALAAEKLGRKLAADPGVVRLQLRQTAQGCDWLIARWEGLAESLDGGGGWTDAQKTLAMALLGFPAELREGTSPLDAPADALRSVAESQAEALRLLKGEALDPLDAADRAAAERGMPYEPDRPTMLARRYAAAGMRQFRWAMSQLKSPRRRDARAPSFAPPPPPSPSPPARPSEPPAQTPAPPPPAPVAGPEMRLPAYDKTKPVGVWDGLGYSEVNVSAARVRLV